MTCPKFAIEVIIPEDHDCTDPAELKKNGEKYRKAMRIIYAKDKPL
jgi:hypothetical protein